MGCGLSDVSASAILSNIEDVTINPVYPPKEEVIKPQPKPEIFQRLRPMKIEENQKLRPKENKMLLFKQQSYKKYKISFF